VVLGRHEACQLVLTSPRLSRLHACIYLHRGRVWIADLNSQNGTKYQDKQLGNSSSAPVRVDGKPSKITLYDQVLEVVAHRG
jgi:pSer/pThr/pTyr-binding forkhead associated (FHA) protein